MLGDGDDAEGNASMNAIKLICRGCGKVMDYDRSLDPTIPATVVRIEQGSCDECWNGDCDSEIWMDASGNEVQQTA
jgi:hypothetical protein